MRQPEAYINFEVYEDGENFVGIAGATLPQVSYITQTIQGAGIAGNVEAVLRGMTEVMTLSLKFRSVTGAAVALMSPVKHSIDLRVAESYWDTVKGEKQVIADKYVMTVVPKTFNPGNIAPASAADASGEYSVYYYAAYFEGKVLWEIDPWNNICKINGVDYMAPVRAALGK